MAGFKFIDEDVAPDTATTDPKPASQSDESAAKAATPTPAVAPPTPSLPSPPVPSPPAPTLPVPTTPPTPTAPITARPAAPVAPANAPVARPPVPPTVPPPATPRPASAQVAPQNPAQARASAPAVKPAVPSPAIPSPVVPNPAVPAPKVPTPTVPSPQVPTPVAPQAAQQPASGAPAAGTARRSTIDGPRPPAAPAPAPLTPTAPDLGGNGGMPTSGELARTMLATHEREKVDKNAPAWRQALDMLDPYAALVFKVAGIVGALSLLYVLWGVFGGDIGHLEPTTPMARQVINNLRIATTALNWSLILMAISLIILMFDEGKVDIGLIILGLAFHFAVPWFLFSPNVGRSAATAMMAQIFRSGGFALTVLGFCKYSLDLMRWIATLPDRVKHRADIGIAEHAEVAQQRVARNATMFSPCWSLPYCREVIRKQCPAYLAKKRCWKFGRGCYCDEEMISRIIRGESMDVIKAPTRLSRQGKPPCGRCYIYLEHQSLKFRSLSWLAIPGTVVAMFGVWPVYVKLFQTLAKSMDKFWAGLSFNAYNYAPGAIKTTVPGAPGATEVNQMSQQQVEYFAQMLFGVILGFMLLIYISKFIEWAIFKAKL